MAKINVRELDPQRYSCIQTEQQELKKQYSSHMEKFMDAQFEKSARCNVDYDKEGTPRKGTRYVSPAVIQI